MSIPALRPGLDASGAKIMSASLFSSPPPSPPVPAPPSVWSWPEESVFCSSYWSLITSPVAVAVVRLLPRSIYELSRPNMSLISPCNFAGAVRLKEDAHGHLRLHLAFLGGDFVQFQLADAGDSAELLELNQERVKPVKIS